MKKAPALPGQVVVVFQGGGALGAYQGGVYQALHEAGIEPNWVIGTSIGAINAAIIAGNDFNKRLDRLREFWDRMERKVPWGAGPFALMGGNAVAYMMTIFGGIAGYFAPNGRWRGASRHRSASSRRGFTRSMLCTRRSRLSSTSSASIPVSRV